MCIKLKDVELKLIAELSKNSRRSDRELAKQLRVSQPSVTRIRNKLEKEGIIREYTVIPDSSRLGYQMASVTLAKMKEPQRTLRCNLAIKNDTRASIHNT